MPENCTPPLHSSLEDRLLCHAARLAFLRDILTQPKPEGMPDLGLGEESLYGFSLLLDDLRRDARAMSDAISDEDIEKSLQEVRHA